MFTKFKSFFKRKEYKVIESYSEGDFEVQVKEDEEGTQMMLLKNLIQNQTIEITRNDSMIVHVIFDSEGTRKIETPIHIYQKLMDEK